MLKRRRALILVRGGRKRVNYLSVYQKFVQVW